MKAIELLGVSLLLCAAMACTDEDEPSQTGAGGAGGQGGGAGGAGGAGGCQAGQLEVDGECVDAGLPTDGCPPGHALDEQSICQPAGVPAELCAEGFESDGDYGCRAILPDQPCEAGWMALPGETACREVAPCASGTWGDIPVEQNTQFVDQSYTGGDSDGTQAKPWTTVQEAVAAAETGAIVAIAAGSYPGEVDLADQPVRLWGRCPALVELVGTGVHVLEIGVGADGSEVRDLALTGQISWSAVAIHGSENVIVDRVWLHDVEGSRGFDITEDTNGGTGVIMTRSLIERARTVAVMVWGSAINMSDTVVRDTQPSLAGGAARGLQVSVNTSTETPSTGAVARSVFARNHDMGVVAFSSQLDVEAVLIQDTMPAAISGAPGTGLHIQHVVGVPPVVTVRSTVIERSEGFGVSILGAEATLEGVVVRDTDGGEPTQSFGYGLLLQDYGTPLTPASATVRFSLIDSSRFCGLVAFSSQAELTGVRIRDTQPNPLDDRSGMGGYLGMGDNPTRASLTLVGSVVERNTTTGLQVPGADLVIQRSVISGTRPEVATGHYGQGIQLWADPSTGVATLEMSASLVEDNVSGGVQLLGAEGIIEQSVIRQTVSRQADGAYGDGIAVISYGGQRGKLTLRSSLLEDHHRTGVFVYDSEATIEASIVRTIEALVIDGTLGDAVSAISVLDPTTLSVRATRLEAAARAGISSFGASVSLESSLLLCNPIALNGETYQGFSASFEDLGGNQCTCAGDEPPCKVLSSSIQPPAPLADPVLVVPPTGEGG